MIRAMQKDGTTIVYVSHFLDEVLELADTVTVNRNGRLVRTAPAAEETGEPRERNVRRRSQAGIFDKPKGTLAPSCSKSRA